MSKNKNNLTVFSAPTQESSMEQLRERYERLHEDKIKISTQRDEAQKRLQQLQAEAQSLFGTDDLEELQAQLDHQKKKNEQRRQEYQRSLDQIEQNLMQIQEQFAGAPDEE